MDPEPGERCLPGMGLSGWMKRTMERSYDLSDICNSPPADGFFYPTTVQKGNNAGVAGKGNCSDKKKDDTLSCTIMGSMLSINQPIQHLNHTMGGDSSMFNYGDQFRRPTAGISNMGGSGCNNAVISTDTPSSVPDYTKPVVGQGFSTGAPLSKQIMSAGLTQNMMESPRTPEEGGHNQLLQTAETPNNGWGGVNGTEMTYRATKHSEIKSHPSDDSAPSPVDHLVNNRFAPSTIVTQADDGGSLRLVDKLGAGHHSSVPVTPDVTPCTTPAVTPACSPQVARRAGNPFFTGGDNSNTSGSWLFRPGKKAGEGPSQSEKLYETKIEFQQQPNSKVAKKTVRYVPRPSELRELNFWSPTSM